MDAAHSGKGLSIVIPVGPGDQEWIGLMHDICERLPDATVLLSATEPQPPSLEAFCTRHRAAVHWLVGESGRAAQLNAGAKAAHSDWLWFLHADCRFDTRCTVALQSAEPSALNYFQLRFFDGPALMRITQIGVALRCFFLQLPFGDQGFLLKRDLFNQLGGFPNFASTTQASEGGEDHALVWKAKQQGVMLHAMGASLATSARKYANHGWLRVTWKHLRVTWRQARTFSAHVK